MRELFAQRVVAPETVLIHEFAGKAVPATRYDRPQHA